jgi:hypothetical protein
MLALDETWIATSLLTFEEALSGRFVAFSRQKEVDRRTSGVHSPVKIHPLPHKRQQGKDYLLCSARFFEYPGSEPPRTGR